MKKHNAFCFGRVALMILAVVFASSGAKADVLILDYIGKSGMIKDAIFVSIDPSWAAGTGNITPFLRLQGDYLETGYNGTDDKGNPDETKDAELCDLALVPLANYQGTTYREFLLDINESKNADADLGKGYHVDLVGIEIYSVPKADITVDTKTNTVTDLPYTTLAANYTPVYELDYTSDGSKVTLDFALNPGSGWGDMLLLVPDALFTSDSYVFFNTTFGQVGGDTTLYPSDDGFEEWAYNDAGAVIPEPATMSLLGLGGLGLLARRRRRAHR